MKLASVLPLSTPSSAPESPKSLQFQTHLYKANALTEADRPTSSSSSSQPPVQSRFYPIWRRALFKIKVRKVLRTINEELLVYGTGHELTDLNQQYKGNIDELITRKVNKRESFRQESLTTETIEEYKGLLHPDHLFKRIWNGLLALLMIYTAVIMPYRLAFSEQVFWDGWTVLEVTVDGVFLLDVGINFASITVNDDGTFETNRGNIACGYLRGWFLIDIISCFPATLIDYMSGGDSMPKGKYNNLVRLARLPRLYKLLRIVRIVKVLKHYSATPLFERCQDCIQLNSRKSHSGLYKLAKFLTSVLLCVHIFGCMWYFSAKMADFDNSTWVVRNGVQDSTIQHQYLMSIYWAVTTASTVGYGDIVPGTQLELVLALLWMVVGVGFYSFTVGSLSSFLTSIDTRDSVLSMKLAAVTEFAKETGISLATKVKIREAIKYNAYRIGNVWSDKHSLFRELPKSLRQEVVLSMYGGAIKDFPIFTLFEASLLTAIVPLLKPMKSESGSYLYHRGDYPDEMFFILHGRVNFVIEESEIVYKSFLRGSYVGEIEIVKKTNRLNSAMCHAPGEFLVLGKSDLVRILADFPAEAQDFRRIAFERSNRNRQALLETLELIRLKATQGSITNLAGQDRIQYIEEQVNEELPVHERLQEVISSMQEEVSTNSACIQEATDLAVRAQKLLTEIVRRTEATPWDSVTA